jgi:hypothetical protein
VATDPTTEQLLADLAATTTAGFYVDGAYYFDWSGKVGDGEVGDNVLMEAGAEDGEAVQFEMTRDAVIGLQQRLTLWLLATKR